MKNAIIITLCIILLSACSQESTKQSEEANNSTSSAPQVELSLAKTIEPPLSVSGEGFLKARERSTLQSEVNGRVEFVSGALSSGSFIAKGELLISIDDTVYVAEKQKAEASVEQAKIALKNAQTQLERLQTLNNAMATSERAIDEAKLTEVSSKANLDRAMANLVLANEAVSDTKIYSPFNARVISETVSKGSLIAPNQPLAEIFQSASAEIEVGLPQSQADLLLTAINQAAVEDKSIEVEVFKDEQKIDTKAIVSRVEPIIDPRTRTVNFIVSLPEVFSSDAQHNLLIGEYLRVEFPIENAQQTYTARKEVVRKGNFVWLVKKDNTLQQVAIDVLKVEGDNVIFTSLQNLRAKALLLTNLVEESEGMKVDPIDDDKGE